MKIRAVVAEDNYVVRAGIEKILETDPEIELVGSCGDLDSLNRLIAASSPHVVVTDIRMPPAQSDEGLEIARRLRRAESAIGVVVLSQYAEPTYARALLEDGAAGRRTPDVPAQGPGQPQKAPRSAAIASVPMNSAAKTP